jgi:hypothetical protein
MRISATIHTHQPLPRGCPGNADELSDAKAGGSGPDHICGAVSCTYNMAAGGAPATEFIERHSSCTCPSGP